MKPRPRRRGALETLSFVIGRDKVIRPPDTVETSPIAFRDWEAAVGTRIAARARPIRLERGVLSVRVATSTWSQELGLLVETIVVQLRARGVAVDTLRFHVGKIDAVERPATRDQVFITPREVALPQALRAEVARVEDPELRRAIAQAAAKNLGWQASRSAEDERAATKRAQKPTVASAFGPPVAPQEKRPAAPPAKRAATPPRTGSEEAEAPSAGATPRRKS